MPSHSLGMRFPCQGCGACCRKLPPDLPLNRGDGVCKHYDEASRLCAVYSQRPLGCRIDAYYAQRLGDLLDARIYYTVQALACAALDPSNAEVPALTSSMLRVEGLGDGIVALDAVQVAEATRQVAATLRPEDFTVPCPELDPDGE